jgi:hypothetical protein
VLVALGLCLALLAPAGVGRATGGGPAAAASSAGAPAGPEQGLLRDHAAGSLVAPGTKRDDRERPGPGLLGGLAALALALLATATARGRGERPARRRAAAAGPRAPPPLQPAPI